jgi:CheY-like chemotaxis protein
MDLFGRGTAMPPDIGDSSMNTTAEARGSILVVEDDADIREAICELLRGYGFLAFPAADGAEALSHLRTRDRPGVILLDLMMAGMNGYQFRAEQMQDPALADIPVIVLTADGRYQRNKDSLGPVTYLTKPMDIERLLELVRRHC